MHFRVYVTDDPEVGVSTFIAFVGDVPPPETVNPVVLTSTLPPDNSTLKVPSMSPVFFTLHDIATECPAVAEAGYDTLTSSPRAGAAADTNDIVIVFVSSV